MSDQRPHADTCRDCGRTGRDRDGCNCIRVAFAAIAASETFDEHPRCECRCNGEHPHADRPCAGPRGGGQRSLATQMVALHMVGWCNTTPDQASAVGMRDTANIADGNICAYMCTPCAIHAYTVARRKVNELRNMFPPGTVPKCPTCGRDIARADDVCERRNL